MNKFISNFLLMLCVCSMSCTDDKVVIPNNIKGSWKCEDYSSFTGNRIYMVDIARSKNDTTMYLLSNFNNENVDLFVFAHLKKSILTIDPLQQIIGTQTVIKSGTGTVSSNLAKINLSYIIYNGLSDITIQSVYTRP